MSRDSPTQIRAISTAAMYSRTDAGAWNRLLASSAPPPSATGESLLVIIDRSARESGLASAITGSEPGAAGSLSIRLEKAPFDTLIAWLARLSQQNGVYVDSATIEKGGAPGLVNAALVLHSG